MSVHVLLDTTFFRTSVPIAGQQRLLSIPTNRGLNEGDTVFLRDESGALTWVTDVLMTGEVAGVDAWSGSGDPTGRYAITGFLARIHTGILPTGKSRLQSPWVTLNSRTLENALPWWDTHVLLYHSTLHLVEGLLTIDEVQQGLKLNCLMQHTSGHIFVPHGEARKRLLVHVKGVDLQCSLCGGAIASLEEATQDHVIPISQGGPDALANIELTHRECNELKGNALPEQYPPMFSTPEQEGAWRPPQFRNGRHVHQQRRGRRGAPQYRRPAPDPTLPIRGTGAANEPVETSEPARVQPSMAATSSTPTRPEAKTQPAVTATPEKQETRDPKTQPAPTPTGQTEAATQQSAKANNAKNNGIVEVDPEWLDHVQSCTWSQLIEFTSERDWASRTASLRTLEQLPRSDIRQAQADGKFLAEAEGVKGTFRLLEWRDTIVLVEQRGNRHNYFVVKPLQAITWETYVWYLTRYGRTTPLAVAMSLLPLWRQGKPDAEGRIHVTKTGMRLEMHLHGNQLSVTELEESTDVA